MARMLGHFFSSDRTFEIDTGKFVGEIREYNDELTGFDERFADIDPVIFRYGGNAYHILGEYARQKRWIVSEIERA